MKCPIAHRESSKDFPAIFSQGFVFFPGNFTRVLAGKVLENVIVMNDCVFRVFPV